MADSPDILGIGVLSPFIRTANDFQNAGGLDHLRSMIGQVLCTMGGTDYSIGELPWRSNFGSQLHLLRHKQNDDITAELARVYVVQALAKWIPQIRVLSVYTDKKLGPGGEENVLEIRITYRLLSSTRYGNELSGQTITDSFNLPS